MTTKGQAHSQPCWVVAGHFAARLCFSEPQSIVLTRRWWRFPCQTMSFLSHHPPAGARPRVNVTVRFLIRGAARGHREQLWVVVRRGRVPAAPAVQRLQIVQQSSQKACKPLLSLDFFCLAPEQLLLQKLKCLEQE